MNWAFYVLKSRIYLVHAAESLVSYISPAPLSNKSDEFSSRGISHPLWSISREAKCYTWAICCTPLLWVRRKELNYWGGIVPGTLVENVTLNCLQRNSTRLQVEKTLLSSSVFPLENLYNEFSLNLWVPAAFIWPHPLFEQQECCFQFFFLLVAPRDWRETVG